MGRPSRGRKTRFAVAAAVIAALLVPAFALGHIERASYWPDPGSDQAGVQQTGGEVPTARSLKSAVAKKKKGKGKKKGKPAGTVRVVCKANSMKLLKESIKDALKNGYDIRPTDHENFTKKEAKKLKKINKKLFRKCRFDEIQEALTASGNNDRVVVMPGVYDEPTARAQPTNDPRCDGLEEENDKGQTGANSYRYVATCPNDQNLLAIIGREPGPSPPQPPLDDRHGIPDNGPCIRCNLQLEGSGVSADDVVVDAGNVAAGNNGPPNPVKDVALKVDRADGFVLRNMTFRHAAEHGIYVHEVDGYVLERFKTFHNEEYGVLTFTSDHGLITDCDAASSGDAGIYPGSAPDTGEQVNDPSGNDVQRLNTEIRNCDMHHNAAGYSGTAANAVWFHHNEVYDNALGFTTDVFTAAGHPGFPQDSDLIEHNNFFSNNFNPYVAQPPETEVIPTIPVPVGTGLWIAGGNNNTLRNNHFWDNWRRGVMLFSVPDLFVCGDNPIAGGNQQHGCDESKISTSFRNRFHDNVMSQNTDGQPDPNGVDFWWDEAAGNTNNCWFGNTGRAGTRESVTADPAIGPVPGASTPGFLPEDCGTSIGSGLGADKVGELLECFAEFDQGADTACSWFETPPEPGRRR